MHLAIAIWSFLAAWRWGDWKHFEKYHKTLLFISCGGLLYEFFTKDYVLWDFRPDFLINRTITDLVYIFVIMPCSTFVFLSTYPDRPIRQALHVAKWTVIYAVLEWVGWQMGRIYYEHGWSIYWSAAFDCAMFPMLRLHFKKPIWAYAISIPLIGFLIWVFHVPLNK